MSRFTGSIERNLRGVEFFSVGACPGCPDCGLENRPCRHCDGDGTGETEPSEHDRECADEGGFSWSPCESCGSTFGGNRYPAHGVIDGRRYHFHVCADCLSYHANGDEPDAWHRTPGEAREAETVA